MQNKQQVAGDGDMREDKEIITQKTKKLLQNMANGTIGREFGIVSIKGLEVIKADAGQFLCTFIIPHQLSDDLGNWHTGAIASLVDTVAAFTVASVTGCENVTVGLSVSYYSSAITHEEVEIEAKAVGRRGTLSSVVVEVRRKDDGTRIALGKVWMNAANVDKKIPTRRRKIISRI